MAKTNGNFYKKSLQLAFISILCQTVNLVRDVFLAKSLGASNLNDIYLISQSTISMFVSMVNSPLATAYVPVTTEYFVSKDKRERNKFISKVYGDIFILSFAIIVISYLFINPITQMVAPGYGFQDVFTRALHAYKIVKCTIKASIVMVIINIILDFLFFKSIGSYGIALASSLAILCVIPMLSRDVIRYIGEFSIKLIVSEIIPLKILKLSYLFYLLSQILKYL